MIDIFKEKPVLLLLALEKSKKVNIYKLAEISNVTYAHCRKLVNSFASKGFIRLKRINGREIGLNLTEKGLMAVKYIKKLLNELNLEIIENSYLNGSQREVIYISFNEIDFKNRGDTDGINK